ncbi:hypothetical protein LSH36_354g02007, partial [Paralvinella palmiformis]
LLNVINIIIQDTFATSVYLLPVLHRCSSKACVWAEIKNATSYQVDLSLDGDGVVLESQCECGAGMAPTASMCITCHGLTKFITNVSISDRAHMPKSKHPCEKGFTI